VSHEAFNRCLAGTARCVTDRRRATDRLLHVVGVHSPGAVDEAEQVPLVRCQGARGGGRGRTRECGCGDRCVRCRDLDRVNTADPSPPRHTRIVQTPGNVADMTLRISAGDGISESSRSVGRRCVSTNSAHSCTGWSADNSLQGPPRWLQGGMIVGLIQRQLLHRWGT
jgi:hypothetical protein